MVVQTMNCNKCEAEMRKWFDKKNEPEIFDVYGAVVTFETGYLSDSLPDCTRYTFGLCEACLEELFSTFKIPPTKEEYLLT